MFGQSQLYIRRGTLKWILSSGSVIINRWMAIVHEDDSRPEADCKLRWLAWSEVGSRLGLIYIHRTNRMNPRNECVVITIIALSTLPPHYCFCCYCCCCYYYYYYYYYCSCCKRSISIACEVVININTNSHRLRHCTKQVYGRRYESHRSSKPKRHKNKIWRKTIFNMTDGILTPCNVACGSGIMTVNSPSGSTL